MTVYCYDLGVPVRKKPGGGFGDRWAGTSYFLGLSERLGHPIQIFRSFQHPDVESITKVLRTTGSITFTDAEPEVYVYYMDVYQHALLPTKQAWEGSQRSVCYQFDGRTRGSLKNPTPAETESFLSSLRRMDYETINVGGMRNLEDAVRDLSRAKAFVGVPSGMAFVALSVGVPSHILIKDVERAKFYRSVFENKGAKFHDTLNVKEDDNDPVA